MWNYFAVLCPFSGPALRSEVAAMTAASTTARMVAPPKIVGSYHLDSGATKDRRVTSSTVAPPRIVGSHRRRWRHGWPESQDPRWRHRPSPVKVALLRTLYPLPVQRGMERGHASVYVNQLVVAPWLLTSFNKLVARPKHSVCWRCYWMYHSFLPCLIKSDCL